MAKSRRGVEGRKKLSPSGFWVSKSQTLGEPKKIHGAEKRLGEKQWKTEEEQAAPLTQPRWAKPRWLGWVKESAGRKEGSFPWVANQHAGWLRQCCGWRKGVGCEGRGWGQRRWLPRGQCLPLTPLNPSELVVVAEWTSGLVTRLFFPQEN